MRSALAQPVLPYAGDDPHTGQGIHGLRIPSVCGHILKGGGDGHILVHQQVVEHLGNLCAGHVLVGAKGPLGITKEVLIVVFRIQQVRDTRVIRVSGLGRGDRGVILPMSCKAQIACSAFFYHKCCLRSCIVPLCPTKKSIAWTSGVVQRYIRSILCICGWIWQRERAAARS